MFFDVSVQVWQRQCDLRLVLMEWVFSFGGLDLSWIWPSE